jgi:tRNA (cmo5U34)-methyltransferase
MISTFSKPSADTYLEKPFRQVPGFSDLHRMVELLLAERVSPDGRVLVLGAGGGLELRAFAQAQPAWHLVGVDPDADMLALAADTNREYRDRIELHHGRIDVAPEGPFDAAVSLLTFHFIPREQRLPTLRQLRQRLKREAPLIVAHISFPQAEPERARWIARHVAYGGTPAAQARAARQAISSRLSILDPAEEEVLMRKAGFVEVNQFYAGLTFRGWVAYADGG